MTGPMTGPSRDPARADITAVVLAAGLSSRMGAFKPLLPLGKATVLERVVTAAQRAGARPVHVVVGHRAEEITPHVIRLGAIPVANPNYRTGMLSSVRAGIASLPDDVAGCLLMPVDIPLVRPVSLERVMAEARRSGAPLVHPAFRGERGHPPFIARRLFVELLTGNGEGGARVILDRHEKEAREIAVFDEGTLRDMDTPADHLALSGLAVTALGARDALPSEAECLAMFEAAGTPDPVRRHGEAIATLAASLAMALLGKGLPLDVERVRAAALLHDIAKGKRHHAEVGADMIRAFGFPALAPIIGHHMALPSGAPMLDETALVYLADKLVCGQDRVTLEQRFAPAMERFADDPAARAGAWRRLADARAVARAVEAMGVSPSRPQAAPKPTTQSRSTAIREIAS